MFTARATKHACRTKLHNQMRTVVWWSKSAVQLRHSNAFSSVSYNSFDKLFFAFLRRKESLRSFETRLMTEKTCCRWRTDAVLSLFSDSGGLRHLQIFISTVEPLISMCGHSNPRSSTLSAVLYLSPVETNPGNQRCPLMHYPSNCILTKLQLYWRFHWVKMVSHSRKTHVTNKYSLHR